MGDGGYKIRSQAAIHFITFAVVEWVDVFTRKEYRDMVLESIRHCQQEKGFSAKGYLLTKKFGLLDLVFYKLYFQS